MKRALAAFAAAWMLAGAAPAVSGGAANQADPPDPVRTPVLQNDTVAVTRLRFGPGAREAVHTHPFAILVVQISPGQIAVQEQNTTRRGDRVGEVWYVPAQRPHAVTSLPAARSAVDMLAIALLPDRQPATAGPATAAPPGITRMTLVDNPDVRVVRVRFSPGSREPVHSHPNDLLTVQTTAGAVEIVNGPDRSTGEREPGFVQFLPRNLQHAYISTDTKPFELLSVTIK
jgi:quercetin dioxygenase-like cupin family protein